MMTAQHVRSELVFKRVDLTNQGYNSNEWTWDGVRRLWVSMAVFPGNSLSWQSSLMEIDALKSSDVASTRKKTTVKSAYAVMLGRVVPGFAKSATTVVYSVVLTMA